METGTATCGYVALTWSNSHCRAQLQLGVYSCVDRRKQEPVGRAQKFADACLSQEWAVYTVFNPTLLTLVFRSTTSLFESVATCKML